MLEFQGICLGMGRRMNNHKASEGTTRHYKTSMIARKIQHVPRRKKNSVKFVCGWNKSAGLSCLHIIV